VLVNRVNTGSPFKQWNRGVRETSGKYIWIAEADDDAEPSLLGRLVSALETNPNAVLAYCQFLVCGRAGEAPKNLKRGEPRLGCK